MEQCPLCESRSVALLYPSNLAPSTTGQGGRYECTSTGLGQHPDIYRCSACTFVFNEPAAGEADHLDEYAEIEDPDYLDQKLSRRLTYARELDRVARFQPSGDLLDVGCYAGFFLEQARDRGYRVQGVEPSRWAALHARDELGLDVWNGPIEDFETDRRFDVVTLWDVIEHLEDPVSVLRCIRKLLKPGGVLAFTTHNLDSALARVMRGRYPFFMEMHTIHMNNRTRDLLLEKSGFERVALEPHRRALRFGYLLSRLRRIGDAPERAAQAMARGLRIANRIVWVGGVGLETIIARPLGDSD